MINFTGHWPPSYHPRCVFQPRNVHYKLSFSTLCDLKLLHVAPANTFKTRYGYRHTWKLLVWYDLLIISSTILHHLTYYRLCSASTRCNPKNGNYKQCDFFPNRTENKSKMCWVALSKYNIKPFLFPASLYIIYFLMIVSIKNLRSLSPKQCFLSVICYYHCSLQSTTYSCAAPDGMPKLYFLFRQTLCDQYYEDEASCSSSTAHSFSQLVSMILLWRATDCRPLTALNTSIFVNWPRYLHSSMHFIGENNRHTDFHDPFIGLWSRTRIAPMI